MTISQAYQQLKIQLVKLYNNKEASNIVHLILEKVCGLNRVERLINKNKELTDEQLQIFNQYAAKLINNTPVQYVLKEAWFAGLKFYVDENVLIPRPETEELVAWIIEDINLKSKKQGNNDNSIFSILDVGTGSGCIAIALKNKLPYVNMVAIDADLPALTVANRNANIHKVEIDLVNADILKSINYSYKLNIIVSNPPYIPLHEKSEMDRNIVLYEPSIALFVPDENPLIFYTAITKFAISHLVEGGSLYFEIHENFEQEVFDLLEYNNFALIQLKKDLQGKNRMIKATLPATKF